MSTTTVVLPKRKELIIAVIGYTGGVGTCLVKAMEKVNIYPYALVRSTTMKFPTTATAGGGGANSTDSDIPIDYNTLAERLLSVEGGIPVIADVTASMDVQKQYHHWLQRGIHVVTANKGIFAGVESEYRSLLEACSVGQAKLLHETTVGAGLPVLGTLQSLKASSHTIVTVEGILSGTLAYVLGQIAGGKQPLSVAVAQAKELGYTEPDPRDDLNGMDVARKAVILARLAGMAGIELSDMEIESLVPESLRSCSVTDFMDQLVHHDEAMRERVAAVEATGGRLHYAAKVDVVSGKVGVGLLSCDESHPFNNAGPDNMVAITTNYYTRPLVIQGAGAGGDVTATGVLADILKCAV
jgi:homoserine dehydrogenase